MFAGLFTYLFADSVQYLCNFYRFPKEIDNKLKHQQKENSTNSLRHFWLEN